jgi:hydroxypyruvate reductase
MERASLRDIALQIFQRTLAAIDVETIVRTHLRLEDEQLCIGDTRCDLRHINRAIIIAIGKASLPMARAARPLLGARFNEGLIVTNETHGQPPPGFHLYLGGHPTPNQDSFNAAAHALELLRRCDSEDTLVLFLLSGGGSAMFELPIDPSLTLEDLQAVNRALVNCGAVIHEMNIVRRHLSAVKGGRLAAAAPRAQQSSLYISDVNSDDLSTVASGPTLPSGATLADFRRVIERYDLLAKFPPRVATLIAAGNIPHLPPAAQQNERAVHHLLLDNSIALQTARRIAEEEFGCVVEIANDLIEGEVETMARTHLQRLLALRAKHPGQNGLLAFWWRGDLPRARQRSGRTQSRVCVTRSDGYDRATA